MTKQAWLMGVMAAGLLLGACDEEGEPYIRTPTQAEIEGKWYLREAQTRGKADFHEVLVSKYGIGFFEDSVFTGTDYYVRFGADSTFEIFQPNPNLRQLTVLYPSAPLPVGTPNKQDGRYRLDGRSLITISGTDTLEWTATFEGAFLSLESAVDVSVRFPKNDDTVEMDERGTLKGMYKK